MSKKSVLKTQTTMYSVHPVTGLTVVHHLPWGKGNPQLEHYVGKGFTYERPAAPLYVAEPEPTDKPQPAIRKPRRKKVNA